MGILWVKVTFKKEVQFTQDFAIGDVFFLDLSHKDSEIVEKVG